jgi:hypothetical protein
MSVYWHVCRVKFTNFEVLSEYLKDGWEPFAADDDWVFLRKKFS